MKESNRARADFVTSVILILFGVGVFWESWDMPRFQEKQANPYSAPGLVPGMLGVIFLLLGAIMFVRSLRRGGWQIRPSGRSVGAYLADPGRRRFLLTLALCLVYSLGFIGHLPYVVATGLFVLLFMLVFEYRLDQPLAQQKLRVAVAFAEALLVAGVVTFVFEKLFLVTLP